MSAFGYIRALAELAEALDAMSSNGILHSDMHLKNILICKTDSKLPNPNPFENIAFKLSDFGLSSTEEDREK